MNNKNHDERTLAFKKAQIIQNEELKKISGGSMTGTTSYTTKESVDMQGNWDVVGDVRWD